MILAELSGEIAEDGYCQHHLEVLDYLEEGLNFRSRFWRRNIIIETDLDYQVVQELDEYVWRFMDSFLLPNGLNAQYWWMVSRVPSVRKRGVCRSLNLLSGTLCSNPVSNGNRYYNYHWIQHDIMCTEYHPQHRENIVEMEHSSKCFVEFFLRKKFDLIYGFAGKYECNMSHRHRYGFIVSCIYDSPYPSGNLLYLDPEYTADAEQWSRILDRDNPTRKCFVNIKVLSVVIIIIVYR